MNIQEAIMSTTKNKPFITRHSWRHIVTSEPVTAPFIIQPTNTPDGCILYNAATKNIRPGWQPRTDDLIADDWEPTAM